MPRYSPGLDPIAQSFGTVKTRMRMTALTGLAARPSFVGMGSMAGCG
jgi:hypothetical protein